MNTIESQTEIQELRNRMTILERLFKTQISERDTIAQSINSQNSVLKAQNDKISDKISQLTEAFQSRPTAETVQMLVDHIAELEKKIKVFEASQVKFMARISETMGESNGQNQVIRIVVDELLNFFKNQYPVAPYPEVDNL